MESFGRNAGHSNEGSVGVNKPVITIKHDKTIRTETQDQIKLLFTLLNGAFSQNALRNVANGANKMSD